jgi:hypothetical protein
LILLNFIICDLSTEAEKYVQKKAQQGANWREKFPGLGGTDPKKEKERY